MTAIAGLVHNGRVWLAGDSAGVAGYSITIRKDPKVFALPNGYVAGYTSSFRMGQLIQHAFTPPKPRGDVHRFMCTTFVDKLRDCLKAGGWATKYYEQEHAGTFLVGIQGHLFVIEGDYQVGEAADGYHAVGCGDDLARGSLHTTRHLHMPPRQRLVSALDAAAHHSAGVAPPYTHTTTPHPRKATA